MFIEIVYELYLYFVYHYIIVLLNEYFHELFLIWVEIEIFDISCNPVHDRKLKAKPTGMISLVLRVRSQADQSTFLEWNHNFQDMRLLGILIHRYLVLGSWLSCRALCLHWRRSRRTAFITLPFMAWLWYSLADVICVKMPWLTEPMWVLQWRTTRWRCSRRQCCSWGPRPSQGHLGCC